MRESDWSEFEEGYFQKERIKKEIESVHREQLIFRLSGRVGIKGIKF